MKVLLFSCSTGGGHNSAAAALAFAAGVVLGLLCTYNVILVFLCLFLVGVVVIGLVKR